jgi:hypothetical protein
MGQHSVTLHLPPCTQNEDDRQQNDGAELKCVDWRISTNWAIRLSSVPMSWASCVVAEVFESLTFQAASEFRSLIRATFTRNVSSAGKTVAWKVRLRPKQAENRRILSPVRCFSVGTPFDPGSGS